MHSDIISTACPAARNKAEIVRCRAGRERMIRQTEMVTQAVGCDGARPGGPVKMWPLIGDMGVSINGIQI